MTIASAPFVAVHGDAVDRAVAPAVRAAQVECDLRDVRPAEVADDDLVGAAERAEVDALDVVQIHRDGRDVAGEERAPAVGDDIDVLVDVRAEEQHRVDAVLAFDRVVAVARVPLEHVVAGAEQGDVVAVVAEDEVIAVAAEQHVRALAAEDRVVAGAAVDRQLHDARGQRGRGDRVIAAAAVDDERVVRAFAVGDVDPRRQADHRNRGAGADHVDVIVAVRAVSRSRCRPAASPAVPPIVPARSMLTSATSVPLRSLTVIVSVPPSALSSTTSTSFVSMTMVPRLRVKRSRSPFADASKISPPLLPLNSIVSMPSWPSTMSLPSPGSHWNTSSPAPRNAVSLPCWPSMKSLPSPPSSVSSPLLPRIVSLPAPPSTVMLDQRGEVAGRGERVVAAVHVHDQVLGRADVDGERRRVEAIEAHARAVRRRGEDLGAVAAVDLGGVDAGAAFHQVGVVAGIPDHAIVAGLAEHLVVAVAAGQHVVAGAAEQQIEAALAEQRVVAGLAEQHVVARAAGQRVVAGAAEQIGARQRAVGFVERDRRRRRPGRTPGSGWCSRPSACRRDRTAPPLTRILPAALRLISIVLSRLSPKTRERRRLVKVPVTAWVEKSPRSLRRRAADSC